MRVEKHADLNYLLKEKLSVDVTFLEAKPLANVDSFPPAVKTQLRVFYSFQIRQAVEAQYCGYKHERRYLFYSQMKMSLAD